MTTWLSDHEPTLKLAGQFIEGIGSRRIDCGARLIPPQPVEPPPVLWSLTPRGVVTLDRKPKGRPR